jgi:hypothetical protein
MRHLTALSLLATALGACSSAPTDESTLLGSNADELTGGHVASESEYPATVSIGGCTAVKVGPRHFLTAAHCLPPTMDTLFVTPDNNAQNFVPLAVYAVNRHPEFVNCTACAGDGGMNDFGLKPDVALVTVYEPTPNIAQAVVDSAPVAVGTSVTLSGYGCENGVDQPTGPARFKVGDTSTVSPSLVWDPSDAPSIAGGYVTTFGPLLDPAAPGLCPGDSGGPLFRTGTNKVIGINALLSHDDSGLSYGNWFTRLDQQSRYNVFAWITNLINQPVPTPCSSICGPPTSFSTSSFSASYIGTGAKCYETYANLTSGNCGGFASGRTLSVNNATMACNGQNWALPPERNQGYCIKVTSGQNAWAWLTTW